MTCGLSESCNVRKDTSLEMVLGIEPLTPPPFTTS